MTFWESLLSQSGKISSKRFFGGIGMALVMAIIIFLTIETKEEPDILEPFMFMCGGLLGLDTFMKGTNRNKPENSEDLSE